MEGVWTFTVEYPHLAASVKVFIIKCWGNSWGRGGERNMRESCESHHGDEGG